MRLVAAVTAAKAAAAVSRGLRVGGGDALSGLVALQIEPRLVEEQAARLGQGSVLITGTNGKTTTARLLRRIAETAGYLPVANRTGSNLMRGLAAALTDAATLGGNMKDADRRIGVFEVDEAILPEAAAALNPRVICFTNLFRDQLDRYGEVERVADGWRAAIARLPKSTTLVLNADDPTVASLSLGDSENVVFFGIDDFSQVSSAVEHAADARWCSACEGELQYKGVYYAHIGHWACPSCGQARPDPQVAATKVEMKGEEISLQVQSPAGQMEIRLPFIGLYNAYNALAALAMATALDLPLAAAEIAAGRFTAAFGRQERLTIEGRRVQIILAKNPAGLNQVLRAIIENEGREHLVFFLNDGLADGRDVSWIWDVDFEMLDGHVSSLLLSGTRAADLAVRLKYAGFPEPAIEEDLGVCLRRAIRGAEEGDTVFVIPTYTAMLNVRGILARWAKRGPFWADRR